MDRKTAADGTPVRTEADAWETAADGALVRSEADAKAELLRLNLEVMHADTFQRNDCLIDSIVQSLMHAGFILPSLSFMDRNVIAWQARQYLRERNLTDRFNAEYLSHHDHLQHIFDFLRDEAGLWVDVARARATEFTVTVYDRFHGRHLEDTNGAVFELPESEPVYIAARSMTETLPVAIVLYCCTHSDSSGYHYEWIRPLDTCDVPADTTNASDSVALLVFSCCG